MDTANHMQMMALRNHLKRYYVSRDWIAQRFAHRNGNRPRILDLACGTGFGSEILSGVGKVVGVDISSESLEYANQHYRNPNTSFIFGNADEREFRESLGEFDAVVSLETVEHLENHYDYLEWVNKSLRPGGVLIVSFPSTFTMDWAVPHHKRDISRRQAAQLFKECGFKVINKFNQGDKLPMHYMLKELNTNPDVPAPPLSQWVKYYLKRPDHMLRRIYQMTIGGGIKLAHQQYLLSPDF
jgi:2-polyprenyl-3-methyl-5-hydroxy-6-metoxy-1,4-benzoquinol methylase